MTGPGTVGWDWAVRPQTEGASGWAGAKLQGRAWAGGTYGKVSRKGEVSLGKFPFTVSSLHPQFSSRPEIPPALLLEPKFLKIPAPAGAAPPGAVRPYRVVNKGEEGRGSWSGLIKGRECIQR